MRASTVPSRAAAAAAALGLLAFAASCSRPAVTPLSERTRAGLEERIGPAAGGAPVQCRRDRLCGSDVLPGFYRAREFRPAWIDDRLELRDARAFLSALPLVTDDGLDPENYHQAAIASLIAAVDQAVKRTPLRVRPEDLVDLEMLLTDGFLLCGSHLLHGQIDPETIHSDWLIKGRVEDLAAVLEKGLATHDVPGALDTLRPAHGVYRGLRAANGEYRKIVARGGWPAFPPGAKLVKGDRDGRVEALRKTLVAMGDLPAVAAAGGPELFDADVEAAVKVFQRRHGLEPDGAVGAETATELNVPAAERLRQIRANLERWRWITQDLGRRYVLVNVADFRVAVHEPEGDILSMEAVVGRAYRQTPDFSGKLSTITLNPAWNVPPKLAREDILPKIRKDPGYLQRMGFRVFAGWSDGAAEIDPATIDWSGVTEDNLSYKFRQDPGPHNALGRIMFLFPNKFDVYMHDTPERWLFGRTVRDFSSGCIRIERPLDLAAYLLRDGPDWTREKIEEAIDSGETQAIRIREPIAVHVLYWTTWIGDDGRVQFRRDIYLRDAALDRALDERAGIATP
jgi:murein L,D-transpeptidase YcbB/YkuD